MSVKARPFWIIPALLVASWLAVRSLAASPAQDRAPVSRAVLSDPPVPLASLSREVNDPALSRFIRDRAVQALGN